MLGIIPLVPGLAAPTQILGRPRLARSSEEAVEERSFCDLCLSILTLYFATPVQQPSVRCHECSIVRDGGCGDKTVGGVAVEIFKFDSEQGDVPRDSQFNDTGIKQLRS